MIKLRCDLNRIRTEKAEDQKVALPVEKELNEQELASVTGGWGGHNRHWGWHRHWGWGGGWDGGWGGCGCDC